MFDSLRPTRRTLIWNRSLQILKCEQNTLFFYLLVTFSWSSLGKGVSTGVMLALLFCRFVNVQLLFTQVYSYKGEQVVLMPIKCLLYSGIASSNIIIQHNVHEQLSCLEFWSCENQTFNSHHLLNNL